MAMGLHYKDFRIFLELPAYQFLVEMIGIPQLIYQIIIAFFLLFIFIAANWIGSWLILLLTSICFLFLTGSWTSGYYDFLIMLGKWYFVGYLFGAVFTILYNEIVYIILNIRIICNNIPILGGNENKFVFAYDRNAAFNIIKSPLVEEELDVPKYLDRLRLYNNQRIQPVRGKPSPYTILFIANPSFLPRCPDINGLDEYRADDGNYKKDPIMSDFDLFLRGVSQGLRSFDSNEILGHPDIWSHVRIITIFDNKYITGNGSEYGLVEANQETFGVNNQMIENLAVPIADFDNKLKLIWTKLSDERVDLKGVSTDDIDIVFALTAVRGNDRSTAQFSGQKQAERRYRYYYYDGSNNNFKHERLVNPFPGKVALNVIGARTKTYIHEFAHAMSHDTHGAIIDEYFDHAVVGDQVIHFDSTFHTINRKNRIDSSNDPAPGETIPQQMADYQGNQNNTDNRMYWTDRKHPSAEEDWTGYFAERPDVDIGCTMDSTYGRYHFDNLIATFMYDRLRSKVTRYLK
jgi:hypothetical protein